MNWKRGLLRLWVVVAAIWVTAAFALLNPLPGLIDPVGSYPNQSKVQEAKAGGYSDDEIARYLFRRSLVELAWILLPPIGLLIVGAAGTWIGRGFKPKSN